MGNFKEDIRKVKAFVFDVDGVFTDGSVHLFPNGDIIRTMNIKDGYACQYAIKKGYPIAIITGGDSEPVRWRFERLGINDIYLKSDSKMKAYEDFLKKYSLKNEEIMYMGDDIPDYEVMHKVAVPVCPSDAAEEVKSISAYISYKEGGKGCVRDVIEQVLRVQGKWLETDAFQW
ncbi:MAG: HAD-IIIA family hydrolase [Bacteroidota bacterium]|nr:HAD-IIIA family hydrolase [Bacteroidota bacterium]MDP4227098.1 HAD-IIIA family hydrolase [Bacteroidota bacterium]MDP4274576.1 HAD-IIIA family hydrolase [Bacteroidota bacterium]